MKTMYVRDLGCPASDNHQVSGETFEEIAEKCQKHAMEKIAADDEEYIAMANTMRNASPEEQQKMFAEYKANFEATPED